MTDSIPTDFKTEEDKHLGTNGLRIEKLFTKKLANPYAGIEWAIKTIGGKDIIVPESWDQKATNFWAENVLYPEDVPQVDISGQEIVEKGKTEVLGAENSFRQVFERVASSFRWWGESFGYFHRKVDAQDFEDEMKYILSHHLTEFDLSHLKSAGLKYAYNFKASNSEGWYLDQDSNETKSVTEKFSRPFLYDSLVIDATQADLVEIVTTQISQGHKVIIDFSKYLKDINQVLQEFDTFDLLTAQITLLQLTKINSGLDITWQIEIVSIDQLAELESVLTDLNFVPKLKVWFNQVGYKLGSTALPKATLYLDTLTEVQQTQVIRLVTICLDISLIMGKFPTAEIANSSSRNRSIIIAVNSTDSAKVEETTFATSAELTKLLPSLPKELAENIVGKLADKISPDSYAAYITSKYSQRLQPIFEFPEAVSVDRLTDLHFGGIVNLKLIPVVKPAQQAAAATPALHLTSQPTSSIVPSNSTNQLLESLTHKFNIAGQLGYLTMIKTGNEITEILVFMPKQPAAFNEMLNGICIGINLSLQAGISLDSIISMYKGMQFEPQGSTTNPSIPQATSVIDYVMQFLQLTLPN